VKRFLLPFLISGAAAQIPSFPGAEGFGAHATGGRGVISGTGTGDVYTVTNLNTSGAGSLADGIATAPAGGRTIVFAVSGYIPVPSSNLRITRNKITIAGQTAPGDGIGLRNGTFRISADDIVIRHVRFRHGKNGSGGDCVDLDSGCQNAVLDHISMAFSTDENISSFGSPPENLTLQWSVNSWGLQTHSAGGLWDQNHATCHHTLWAHNHTRNPKSRPNGLLEWVNNVTFDWNIGFIMGDSNTPAAWKANVINSYFLCPPGNLRSQALQKGWLDRNASTATVFSTAPTRATPSSRAASSIPPRSYPPTTPPTAPPPTSRATTDPPRPSPAPRCRLPRTTRRSLSRRWPPAPVPSASMPPTRARCTTRWMPG
jgi:pectate lyase